MTESNRLSLKVSYTWGWFWMFLLAMAIAHIWSWPDNKIPGQQNHVPISYIYIHTYMKNITRTELLKSALYGSIGEKKVSKWILNWIWENIMIRQAPSGSSLGFWPCLQIEIYQQKKQKAKRSKQLLFQFKWLRILLNNHITTLDCMYTPWGWWNINKTTNWKNLAETTN